MSRAGRILSSFGSGLRGLLVQRHSVWLLLVWDVRGMDAALVRSEKNGEMTVLAGATSRQGRFVLALGEIMASLGKDTAIRPRQVALAARHVLPAVTPLPVQPDKPRSPPQMRELIQAEVEQTLAEFGSLWSIGALLQARGYLSAADRERITLEEAVRRQNRAAQLRYGEIAIELGLIGREALDECLDQQAALQNLDATVQAGWHGRIEDKQPLWLVCAVGRATYEEWREALALQGLALAATLPLAWLASDPALQSEPVPTHRRELPVAAIDLEIRAEEVTAVLRRQGRVVATRSEGRVERSPAADWIYRLIADWSAEPRATIRLHFIDAEDDALGDDLADALNLTTGHPCTVLHAVQTRAALWRNLYREASAPVSQLPRMVARELRGSPWHDPDVRRLLALGGVLLIIAAAHAMQQYRLASLEQRMTDMGEKERQQSETARQLAQVNLKLAELGKSLDSTRRELEPLLNDRSRLTRILAMQVELPELLYQLAQAVGSDAVLEAVHNDNSRGEGSAIQVIAWSPSYTGAQAFIDRIALLAHQLQYGVSQTGILERKGRDNRSGHEVKFWLLPEADELESDAPPATAAVPAGPPQSGGISARPPLPGGKP